MEIHGSARQWKANQGFAPVVTMHMPAYLGWALFLTLLAPCDPPARLNKEYIGNAGVATDGQ